MAFKATVWIWGLLISALFVDAKISISADIKRILLEIPENDTGLFIAYHLNRGFQLVQEKPEKILSDEDTVKLFEFVVNNLTHLGNSRNEICFPGYGCIDPDDPGVHPSFFDGTVLTTT